MAEQTIQERIKYYSDKIEAGDTDNWGPKLRVAALSAIYGGFGSQSWRDYMKYFASTPKQMRRLCTREIDCNDAGIDDARAYLVGNAVCLPETWKTFGKGVEHYLDATLDQYPE